MTDMKAGSSKMTDVKAGSSKMMDVKASSSKMMDVKIGSSKMMDVKAGSSKMTDMKAGPSKMMDVKAGSSKMMDVKASSSKMTDVKIGSSKMMDVKAGSSKMTDEERLKLAERLDSELDEFINGLEKKRYSEGWPEDKWQEEFDKHPFFMKNMPAEGQELSPLMEGLQKLKYDPEENTPEELALAYKEDGNFHFKLKKYRMAIIAYTEGLKANCNDKELEALLYNNRAAAHYFLKNYRSCLNDCEKAVKLKENYTKAILRAANCALYLSEFDRCIAYCDEFLLNDSENKEVLQLRLNAQNQKKQFQRDVRRQDALDKREQLEEKRLIEEITNRGVKIAHRKGKPNISLADLEPNFPDIAHNRVFLNSEGCLIWPVVLLYPEYKTMDFIQECNETTSLKEHLSEIFESPPGWDENKKYMLPNLRIYFENKTKRKFINVDMTQTLGQILKHEDYIVQGGVPSFLIFVANSAAEKKYLEINS